MEKVALGKTDLRVAPINLGGNVFGWTLDEKQSFEILDGFASAGFDFIDTADTYSHWAEGNKGGESETIIGNWMAARGNRDQIIIATKVGSATKNEPKNISRAHILETAEASLKRLKTDYIDLYYTHYDDDVTPVDETLEAYQQLVTQGKVRYIGASNVSPQRLIESIELAQKEGLPVYTALQPHYNLVERAGYEKDYAPIADRYGLSVLPYWSLASGFLTGKYRSEADLGKSARGEGVKQYLNEKGLAVLSALDNVAKRHNVTPATVALAWLLHKPHVDAPIVSATSQHQLDTIFAAPTLRLDDADMRELDGASSTAV